MAKRSPLELQRQLAESIARVKTSLSPRSLAEHYAHVRRNRRVVLSALEDLRKIRAANVATKLPFDPRGEEALVVAMTFAVDDSQPRERAVKNVHRRELLDFSRSVQTICPILREHLTAAPSDRASPLALLSSTDKHRRAARAALASLEAVAQIVGTSTVDPGTAELHHALSVPVQSAIDFAELFNAQMGEPRFTARTLARLLRYWGIDAGPNPASRLAGAWSRRKPKQWRKIDEDHWVSERTPRAAPPAQPTR